MITYSVFRLHSLRHVREHHLGNSARGPHIGKDLYWEEDAARCEAECTFLFAPVV